MSKSVLIYSDSKNYDGEYDYLISWNSFQHQDEVISIPDFIEKNSEKLKDDFLSWLHLFPLKEIKGKKIIDHLKVREDFSSWWTSSLFEKSIQKSPKIYQVFQLAALEKILEDIDDINQIYLQIPDKAVNQSIQSYCRLRKINYKKLNLEGTKQISSFFSTKVNFVIPKFFFAIGWLFKYLYRNNLHRVKKGLNNQSLLNGHFFVSYFFNLDIEKTKNGNFYTKFWTYLHSIIEKENKKVNWLHFFEKSTQCDSISTAKKLITSLNEQDKKQTHSLIAAEFTMKVVLKSIKDYFVLAFNGLMIERSAKIFFIYPNMKINFYVYLKGYWKDSLYGKNAISSCLFLNSFEKFFSEIPYQKKCFYLMENQPWERTLVYSWRKNNHGEIFGCPHTTISDWDLRYYYHPDEYKKISIYHADFLAVNGNLSRSAYLKSGFPEKKLVNVEALRFAHYELKKNNKLESSKGLLIVGDSNLQKTMELINLIHGSKIEVDYPMFLKPHPLTSISVEDLPSKKLQISTLPLSDLMQYCHIAIATDSTAGSLDAYLSNKKTLIMHNGKSFNLSPLRATKNVTFIRNHQDLEEFFGKDSFIDSQSNFENFFFVDKEFRLWKKLLN